MDLIEGYDARKKDELEIRAWGIATLINYLTGNKVTISKLLPEMFPPKVLTKEEHKKAFDEVKKMVGIK